MSKVTRSKLKPPIYSTQETNKINRKFFQILNDFLESTLLQAGLSCHESDFLLVETPQSPSATCGIGLRIRSGCFNGSSCQKKKTVQHEHCTHTAPDIPSSTALSFLPAELPAHAAALFSAHPLSGFPAQSSMPQAKSCISDLVLRYSA